MPDRRHPLLGLQEDELDLIQRFVLASGSLKELAAAYGVSYPTIRGRLDRLIERMEVLAAGRELDPMSDLLARLVEQGEISPSAAREVRELHRSALARIQETEG